MPQFGSSQDAGTSLTIGKAGRLTSTPSAASHTTSIWRGCFVAQHDSRQGRKVSATLLGASCPPDARAKLFTDYTLKPPGCEIKAARCKYGGSETRGDVRS